jgi:hypothetical protein
VAGGGGAVRITYFAPRQAADHLERDGGLVDPAVLDLARRAFERAFGAGDADPHDRRVGERDDVAAGCLRLRWCLRVGGGGRRRDQAHRERERNCCSQGAHGANSFCRGGQTQPSLATLPRR